MCIRDRAQAGLCSRREAERWIDDGRVTVNGKKASVGDKADPRRDKIFVDGKPIGGAEEKVYLMLYKPRGYVTTMRDERGRKTVADLVRGCLLYTSKIRKSRSVNENKRGFPSCCFMSNPPSA